MSEKNNFYNYRTKEKIAITIKDPEVEMSIINRLGKPKFWVSNNDFTITMNKIYKTASKNAQQKFFNSDKQSSPQISKEITTKTKMTTK